MMQDKISCSVLILTLNCAESLRTCLKNLQPFGEILVHDGNSTDDTVAIAKKYGARVLKQFNTDAPNMRVQDFTAMRLKQRDDAAYDWVLYLDADEILSDEIIGEIAEILKHAHKKTIVKFPRLPVVDGNVIRHGAFWPEVMPRIHHRYGGCTLQPGKSVHEKYVYDESFAVVVTNAPLYVPMPAIEDLQKKDDTYILLESNRMRQRGRYPWRLYLRWFLIREPIIMLYILVRVAYSKIRYGIRRTLPFVYEWRAVRYHAKLLWQMTKVMFSA